jgi:ATP-binding cassette, subfamily B, bacterial
MFKSIIQMARYFKGQQLRIYIIVFLVIFNTVVGVAVPYITSIAIDKYIVVKDISGLFWLLLGLFIMIAFGAIASYFQTYLTGLVSLNTLYKIRTQLFDAINSLPMSFFNKQKAGDLVSRLNNDTDKINGFLSESLVRFVGTFFEVIGTAIFIFWIDVKMALVLLSTCVFLLIINYFLSDKTKELNKNYSQDTGALSAKLQDDLTNFKAIYTFDQQKYLQENLITMIQTNQQKGIAAKIITGIFLPIYNFGGNIAQILVLVSGLYFVGQGQLTVGILIGFISYARKFYLPLSFLGSIWGSMQAALASWTRIQEIFEANAKNSN